jgi:hypothetical protein
VRHVELPQVLLDRFDVSFQHAARLQVQECGAGFAHSQEFQNFPTLGGIQVMALAAVWLSRYPEQKKLVTTASTIIDASWLGMA